jgi:hypothetical protein
VKYIWLFFCLFASPAMAAGGASGASSPGMVPVGTFKLGNCLKSAGGIGVSDAGAPCGSGSGGTPGGTSGQIQYNNAGAFAGFTASGDCTINTSTGVMTCASLNGVSYGASPSTNTVPVVTSSNTVTYEAVPNAALAHAATTVNGQTCTLGSTCTVTAAATTINGLLTNGTGIGLSGSGTSGSPYSISNTGVLSFTGDSTIFNNSASTGAVTASLISQVKNTFLGGPTTGANAAPTFRALVGADLPNPSASTLGGIESLAAVSHNFLTSISTSGVPAQAQPAFTDISGQATNAQLATQTANTVLGALTATTPSGLAVPSCSTSASALNYTSGTGFSCNTSIVSSTATTATNLAGGALGSIPYQNAANTTLFLAGTTSAQPNFVTSTGTGAATQAPVLTSSTGSGNVVLATSPSIATPTVTGSFTATGLVTNADLANSATTVNGQTCTLGSTCTVTATAATITVGTTNISGGSTGNIEFNNAGVLGEKTVTGSGSVVVLATSPTVITPTILLSDATTTTAPTIATLGHNTSGTAAAGFGSLIQYQLQDSTTASTNAADRTTTWVTATHASRTARQVFNIYDTAAREALRLEASGTAPMIGFLGSSASAQQTGDVGTALTTFGLMSGTPSFAVANLTGTTLPSSVVTSSLTSTGALTPGGNLTMSTHNIVTDTSTGTQIGTGSTQKIGFFGATPVVMQTGNVATALTNLGLVTSPTITANINANLTGPITSSGNATSIASQTGTGTKFVVDTSPTLVTPTIGAATATSVNFGQTSLSYYGEGTWTPAVTTTGTAGTPAYSIQEGDYTRIGREVTARFSIILSGWTGSPSGNVNISGLPFTSSATTNNYGGCAIVNYAVAGLASNNYGMSGLIQPGATVVNLLSNSNTAANFSTAAQIGTTPTIVGVCHYHV